MQRWCRSGSRSGVEIAVAHGALVAVGVPGYDVGPLLEATPDRVRTSHALLRVPVDVAVERVRTDAARGPAAASRDERWLRDAHTRFTDALAQAPPFRWDFDTAVSASSDVAHAIAATLVADESERLGEGA